MAERTYEEAIEYYLVGDTEILKASDADIAIRELNIENAEDALESLKTEELPPDVDLAQARLEARKKGEDRPEDLQMLGDWRRDRNSRWLMHKEQKRQEEFVLSRMQDTDLQGVPIRREVYTVRRFAQGEYRDVEEECLEINQELGTRRVNLPKRDDLLLGITLISRKDDAGDTEKLEPGDVRNLSHQAAEVLIQRMWIRNGIQPHLAAFFRGGRGGAGGN